MSRLCSQKYHFSVPEYFSNFSNFQIKFCGESVAANILFGGAYSSFLKGYEIDGS
jgi:hypothetical protein